jgi:hypothetical protein
LWLQIFDEYASSERSAQGFLAVETDFTANVLLFKLADYPEIPWGGPAE